MARWLAPLLGEPLRLLGYHPASEAQRSPGAQMTVRMRLVLSEALSGVTVSPAASITILPWYP